MRYAYWVLISVAFALTGCQSSKPLFNGRNLDGWSEIGSSGSWCTKDCMLVCNGKKDGYAWLSTDKQYCDFKLTLECRFGPDANTGVFCRAPDREGRTSMRGFEVQLRDDRADTDLTDVTGAIFSRVPGTGKFTDWPGKWNQLTIVCRGRHVRTQVNGRTIVNVDMNSVVAKGNDPPMSAVPDCGYIGLQNHGSPAEFRNICIKEFDSKKCGSCANGS